jgi:hypothetical protein
MELVPEAEFSIVTRASSKAWIPELIAAAGAQVTETYIDFFTSTRDTLVVFHDISLKWKNAPQIMWKVTGRPINVLLLTSTGEQ